MAARKRAADREIDLHGYTSSEARARLNGCWATREWQGLQRICIIHGTGSVLHALVRLWSEEKGITWTTDPANPGVTILHPGRSFQPTPPTPHRPLKGLKTYAPAAKLPNSMAGQQVPAKTVEPAVPISMGNQGTTVDSMAAEFDRLNAESALSLHRHKQGLLPSPQPSPDSAAMSSGAPSPKPRFESTQDLMAQEFARLGSESVSTVRKHKTADESS